jgi:hypothetical protein
MFTLGNGHSDTLLLGSASVVDANASSTMFCPLGIAAYGVRLCPLHRRLDNALDGRLQIRDAAAEPATRLNNVAASWHPARNDSRNCHQGNP